MSRIKIELPERFHFSTEIPLRISDINYGGHLGNDAVLSIIHEARVRFLNSLGYTESNIEGSGIIMADAAIQYKSEGFYGDVLTVDVAVAHVETTGCDLFYRLVNRQSGKEIALAKTAIVFFNYETRHPQRIPDAFAVKFST